MPLARLPRVLRFFPPRFLPAALVLALTLATASPPAAMAGAPGSEELRLGERIYREGILPSGQRLQASMKGEQVPGLTFSCAGCHLRSGLGSYDEGVYTPAVNGEKLFKPLPRQYKGIEQAIDAANPPLRSAYTEETLLEALRSGKDPAGKTLSDAMPRYHLEEKDGRLLAAYLKTLSVSFSPGVTENNLHFATVISEDAPADQRQAMLSSLTYFFNLKNNQIRGFSNPRSGAKSRQMAENMVQSREFIGKTMTLARWVLKDPPESWRAQLEEYNRKEPAFALVGGLVRGPWEPVHRFCEENGIPAILPNTELPVISETDWYTLYQSKGYYQEGEGAARFLSGEEGLLKKGPVLQLVSASPEGKALEAGFRQTWRELGRDPVKTVELPEGKGADPAFLRELLSREKPQVLLVWADAGVLPALEGLEAGKERPAALVLSARLLGERIWTLKEPLRDLTYLTYPFAFSVKYKNTMGKQLITEDRQPTLSRQAVPVKSEVQKVTGQTNTLTQFLGNLLMDLKGNYYRDNILDVAGMMPDQSHPLYGRLSFGTGQRYTSRGCYIVQLTGGATPQLVKKSGWLTR